MKLLRYLVSTAVLLHAAAVFAQIQIHPLPDHPAAQVLPLGARALNADDADAWITARLSAAIKRHTIDGGAVVVVKDGQLLVSRGDGLADPSDDRRVDPTRTAFALGGLSQAVTATAVMQQVAKGRLDMDADINRYLDFRVAPRDGRALTLRDLLTGESGFDAVRRDLVDVDATTARSNDGFSHWIKRSLPARVRQAGEVPAASDYAVALAGYIVQRVSGQPFAAYVRQHVFKVLGMDHASFEQPLPASLRNTLARTHGASAQTHRAAPAQALVASAADMGHFMIAQLQNGHDGRAQILDFDTAKAMHAYARQLAPGLTSAGLGFVHIERPGQRLLVQHGDLDGMHSAMVLLPEKNVGIFVVVSGASGSALARSLTDDFIQRYVPPLPQRTLSTLDTARAHAAELVGAYLSSERPLRNWRSLGNLFSQQSIRMAGDGSLLTSMFADTAGKPRRWREVQPFVWQDAAGSERLSAHVEQGRVRWVSTDTLEPREAFVPVAPKHRAGWNFALLGAVLLIFLLTLLLWLFPTWRRGDARFSAWGRRWVIASRLTALDFLLVAGGWWLALTHVGASWLDLWLRLLQVLAALALVGVVTVLCHAFAVWRTRGQPWRKLHATVLLLASVGALWFVFGYHLLSLTLHY